MALKKSQNLSLARSNKNISSNSMIRVILTGIIGLIFLFYSYKYLATIDKCSCGNKTNIHNMEWVDKVFIIINLINIIVYSILFFTGFNIVSIFTKLGKLLPLLIFIFSFYGLFILYLLILFVINFFNYYYTLPKDCVCDKDDMKKYVLYAQGGMYSLNMFFVVIIIVNLIFKAVNPPK
jgi:hypothetical protein